jgi:hypothetical protein
MVEPLFEPPLSGPAANQLFDFVLFFGVGCATVYAITMPILWTGRVLYHGRQYGFRSFRHCSRCRYFSLSFE